MPRAEVHADLFKGANRVFKKMPWKKIELQRQNKDRSEGEERLRLGRALRRDAKRAAKIAEVRTVVGSQGDKGVRGCAGLGAA